MKWLDNCLLTLAVIGCIVWGLIGFFQFNLVSFIFGNGTWLTRVIYALVGLSGLYLISFTEESVPLWRIRHKKMGVFSIRSTPIFRKPGSLRAKPLLSPVHIPADPLCF